MKMATIYLVLDKDVFFFLYRMYLSPFLISILILDKLLSIFPVAYLSFVLEPFSSHSECSPLLSKVLVQS